MYLGRGVEDKSVRAALSVGVAAGGAPVSGRCLDFAGGRLDRVEYVLQPRRVGLDADAFPVRRVVPCPTVVQAQRFGGEEYAML